MPFFIRVDRSPARRFAMQIDESDHMRTCQLACIAAFGFTSLLPFAYAQSGASYPVKPVRMVVPFPAGGGADILARFVSRKLSEALAAAFVVENRSGAAGSIGLEAVARSASDGYTLLMSTSGSHTTNPAVVSKLPYDPVKDFAAVALVAEVPFILLVHPSLPVRNVKELIALAKAKPGELSYGSSGVGSTAHLGFELFNSMAGIKSLHVPYKGAGQATADTLAGNIMMAIGAVHPALPHLRQGRLRGLGVGSTKRSPLLPDVPTIAESGLPGFELVSWYAVFAPGRTSPDIVRVLNTEIVKMIAAPDVREQLAALGADPVGSTPSHLAEIVRNDLARWTRIAREVKIRAD